jgi:hypothetical protein
MAEDRPWLFPTIPSLDRNTQLYTAKRSSFEDPEEYKFTIETLVNFLISEFDVGLQKTPVGWRQQFTQHTGSILTWTENNGAFPDSPEITLAVYQNGKKLLINTEYALNPDSAVGESQIIITNPLPFTANYEVIALNL